MTILTAAMTLFLVLDPIGNVPLYLALLKNVHPQRRGRIIIRELCIALGVLVLFLFLGRYILFLLHVSEPSLSMAGGIILFLIAIRMIFSDSADMFGGAPAGEPFIVPLAIPLVAGPSALATIMLLMAREPDRWSEWLLALLFAWTASVTILLLSAQISRFLGKRGMLAMERLMGMLLTTVAVEMFISGFKDLMTNT